MTKIYYFSGTGNSLWSAKKIAAIIGDSNPSEKCELYNIGTINKSDKIIIEADAVIIIFPSFAYGMPLAVYRFAKNAAFKTDYLAALVTFGSNPLGTLGSLRRLLKKKEINKMFFARIPAVENYLAMFGTPDAETIESRSKMQKKATEEAAASIIERKENRVCAFYPFSFMVWHLFLLGIKIFYKYYKVGNNCSGCSVCEKICPVSAISMKDGKPVFSSKCEHCQGCINICPLRAIQYVRVKFGSKGYIHPEIKINELIKANNGSVD